MFSAMNAAHSTLSWLGQKRHSYKSESNHPPAFTELIQWSAQHWAWKPNMHNEFSKLHFCILHVHDNSCGMMGWMWALIIHPSCGGFLPASLIVDVFLFRKSLHRQQEGDRRGQNPWTQHVHEGNRTSCGAPVGTLPARSVTFCSAEPTAVGWTRL